MEGLPILMNPYLTYRDLYLLRDYSFTPGYSGESWFGEDKYGEVWQAYIVEDDSHITFVNEKDRSSVPMTREEFKERFINE